jgi:hypothetical protein
VLLPLPGPLEPSHGNFLTLIVIARLVAHVYVSVSLAATSMTGELEFEV